MIGFSYKKGIWLHKFIKVKTKEF